MRKKNKSNKVSEEHFDSEFVSKALYNHNTRALRLEFTSGRIYEYYDVDEDTYNEFVYASSQGKAFNNFIKSNFKYNEIDQDL